MLEKLRKRIRDRVYCYLPLEDYYGRDFKRISTFLHGSRNWDRERMEAFKLDRLRLLLEHAQATVPYYRDQFRKLGFDYRDVKTLDDFAQLPILSKETLRNELDRLKADDFDSYKPLYTKTSGTTAGQTLLYRSRYQEDFRKAVVWRFFSQFGHKPGNRWVNIVCRNFDPNSPVAEYSRLDKCLLINTYHIIKGNREEIIEAIRDFRPNMIWTHPSPMGILAEHAISKGIEPIEVPIVATYAEKMFPHIRKVLTQFFPAKYIEYYGNRENSFASWGLSDDTFHEISEYCHMEVVNRGVDGVTGDLISTSLHNYAVPLIRYDPGDLVRWIGYPDDNASSPMIELLGGRGKDVLVTRDGLTVPYFLAYIDAEKFDKLKKYQIEQIGLDEVILRVVPKENYIREQDEPLLLQYASESFARKFHIRLEYVDDIPLTDGGKYRSVISKLAVEYFDRTH